jgi:cytochrome P450 family 135
VGELPPGPPLPSAAQTLLYTFHQPRFFAACRARYGATFTLRLAGYPPAIVTRDRDAIRRLFTGDPLTKRNGNDLFRPALGDRSLLTLEPDEHLVRRKLELPSFHGDAIRGYAERIQQLIDDELTTWSAGEEVVSHPRARALTLQIILELVLGVSDVELAAELASHFDFMTSPISGLALFLPPALLRRGRWNLLAEPAYRRVDRVRELLSAHVAGTRSEVVQGQTGTVLAMLIASSDENGTSLTDIDLRDELVTLVVAGHETTATAIAWGCDLLAHNLPVAARLRDSLERGERDYLKATAKEVLRMSSLAYVSAARQPLEPFTIGPWTTGPDTLVLVDAQGVHRDPELHLEPDEFRPERFLEGQPDGYAYLPFGGGAHRCLGAALATLELELFLATMVTCVELAPAGSMARPVRRGAILAPDTEGRVRVARRLPKARRPEPAAVTEAG